MTTKTAKEVIDALMAAYIAIQADISTGEAQAKWARKRGCTLEAEGFKLRALGSRDALSWFHNALMEIRHDILPNKQICDHEHMPDKHK